MSLAPECPRCPAPVTGAGEDWACADHGATTPLWRPAAAGYDAFVAFLGRSPGVPAYAWWPLTPGWTVTDFGCVGREGTEARAAFVTCAGPSELDGVVDLTAVAEEPGVGLGARCAGTTRTDPGADIGEGAPQAKVRLDEHPVPLWAVSTSDSGDTLDRSVLAGEAGGRWLWLVLRPASAALLLTGDCALRDVSDLGPALVDLPFGGPRPAW